MLFVIGFVLEIIILPTFIRGLLSCRKRVRIDALKGPNDEWISDVIRLKGITFSHFQSIYGIMEPIERLNTLSTFLPLPLTVERDLTRVLSSEEVRKAIFAMGAFKSPGPDGFQAIFYQKNWSIISSSVITFTKDILEGPRSIASVNNTLLVLIPKVDQPETIKQFRPINLCNVSYKLITKIIASCLRGFLSDIISPYQSSFVPGRRIQDNVVIPQELIHTLDRLKRAKKFMVVKVDLEKAYDMLSWDFLNETLILADIPTG